MTETVLIDKENCTGCGRCIAMCPKKILYLDKETNKCMVTDGEKCDRLRGCEMVCPADAIRID
jgi:2-oxoglutarate ferredoxin oxidoreductase subunit delta